VQLTAKSMLPSWLKSPATSNSGAMMLPVRWLAEADGRNAAERIKQKNAENGIFFIIVYAPLLKLDLTNLEMRFNILFLEN